MLHIPSLSAFGKLHRSGANLGEWPVWMAPASQAFFVIAIIGQYSRVFGLFAWRSPLALMSSASKVPIGYRASIAEDDRQYLLIQIFCGQTKGFRGFLPLVFKRENWHARSKNLCHGRRIPLSFDVAL
ncbi:MAG: hypothetical protein R3186_10510, partial [Ruegeria sp.]|nr:hypothetical protein [Ruegeria sp.]